MKYHVETMSRGVCVNATAFRTLAEANDAQTQFTKEDAERTGVSDDVIAHQIRASVLDLDDSDECPIVRHNRRLVDMGYTYVVTECTDERRCTACYEAGFISL